MAIAVPSLDDRSYADLVDEARALIPVYDPSWTNHNASDPGITLVELFAWLTEMQIYSLDQITDEHRLTFLRLLNGPDLKPTRNADQTIDKAWLDLETGKSLDLIRQRSRAVSAQDYEVLACQVPDVKRAKCVPRRNLEAGNEASCLAPAPGHVSVVIVPAAGVGDAAALRATVRDQLEPARILTTRLHVVPPTSVPVATRIMVARRSDILEDALTTRIKDRLAQWLDPLTGGDGNGWPFGRGVYVSELNAVLEQISGVDYIGDAILDSKTSIANPQDQPAQPIWHESGALVGLGLAAHHLPRSPRESHQVLVVDWMEPVRITVGVTPSTTNLADARRAIMQTLKDYLWSLQKSAFDAHQGFDLSEGNIRSLLNKTLQVMAVVSSIGTIAVDADKARRSTTATTAVYTFKADEFFQATCQVDIAGPAT